MGASTITLFGSSIVTTPTVTTYTVPPNTRWLLKKIIGSFQQTSAWGTNSVAVYATIGGVKLQLCAITTTGLGFYPLFQNPSGLWYAAPTTPGTVVGQAGSNPDNLVLNAGDTISFQTVVESSATTIIQASGVAYSLV